MRIPHQPQLYLGCPSVTQVTRNTNCRDRMIPILRGLQHLYSQPRLRDQALDLITQDVVGDSDPNRGRPDMTLWQILVLASVRQGCDCTYDHLQDLAENHRNLRDIMQVFHDWHDEPFDWRRIRDNVCLVQPDTIEKINHLIVAEGHRLAPHAVETIRGDTFVAETNVHYPTESSLILDGLQKIFTLAPQLASLLGALGWRQAKSLSSKAKRAARNIGRVKKGANYQTRLQTAYDELLQIADVALAGHIKRASFDRGFHSPENQTGLAALITHPCLPKPGVKQGAAQASQATVEFRQARQSHPGVESAIGALQSGNGLARCRDHSQVGYLRYVGLDTLGRNLLTLGKLLLSREDPECLAGSSQRDAA